VAHTHIQTNPPGRRDTKYLIHADNFLEPTHLSGSEDKGIENAEVSIPKELDLMNCDQSHTLLINTHEFFQCSNHGLEIIPYVHFALSCIKWNNCLSIYPLQQISWNNEFNQSFRTFVDILHEMMILFQSDHYSITSYLERDQKEECIKSGNVCSYPFLKDEGGKMKLIRSILFIRQFPLWLFTKACFVFAGWELV